MNKRTKDILAKYEIETIDKLISVYPEIKLEYWTVCTDDYINKTKITCTCICGVKKEIYVYDIGKKSKSCGCMKSSISKATNLDRYGFDNPSKLPEIKKKKEETCLSNYGTKNPMQSSIVKERSIQKCMQKYGVPYSLMSKKVRDKGRAALMERYGVDIPLRSEIIKKRSINTCLLRYGVTSASKIPKTRKKAADTCKKRHGYDNAMKSPEIKKRQQDSLHDSHGVTNPSLSAAVRKRRLETNMRVRGVPHPSKCPIVRKKYIKTMIDNEYSSIPELELKEWIKSNFDVDVSKSYIGGDSPKEIDILIKKDGINILAIEYNGDYWHSEVNKSIHKDYHKYKTEQARIQKKCQLIHVFDSEWQTKKDIVKGFIRSKLEKGTSIRASKCEIKEVLWEDAKEFCNNYHLQGKPQNSKLSLGLYHKDELISLMTFSKPHRQNMGDEYHLSRYVIKHGYRIHGGLSRLSKHAHSKIGDFITYVHLRLSSGDSYLKAGYKHVGDVRPDYWYWDTKKHKIVSKQSRRKSNVNTPEGMTEREHAIQDKLYRIWDCGKIKLRYSKTSQRT